MSLQIETCGYKGLTEEDKDNFHIPNNGCGKEEASYIKIIEDDKTTEIYSDAMEPEDAYFYRDLNWIASAIEAAYEKGIKDASN